MWLRRCVPPLYSAGLFSGGIKGQYAACWENGGAVSAWGMGWGSRRKQGWRRVEVGLLSIMGGSSHQGQLVGPEDKWSSQVVKIQGDPGLRFPGLSALDVSGSWLRAVLGVSRPAACVPCGPPPEQPYPTGQGRCTTVLSKQTQQGAV